MFFTSPEPHFPPDIEPTRLLSGTPAGFLEEIKRNDSMHGLLVSGGACFTKSLISENYRSYKQIPSPDLGPGANRKSTLEPAP